MWSGVVVGARGERDAQQLGHRQRLALMVERGEIVGEVVTAAELGRGDPDRHRIRGGEARQIGGQRLVGLLRGDDDRSVSGQPTKHDGAAGGDNFALEPLAIDIGDFGKRRGARPGILGVHRHAT